MLQGFTLIILVFILVFFLRGIFTVLSHLVPANIRTKYQHHPNQQFFVKVTANFSTGLIVFFLLGFVQHFPFVMDVEDANLDFAMQLKQDNIPAIKEMPSFVFLDVDNQTHGMWGEPFLHRAIKPKMSSNYLSTRLTSFA